MPKQGCFVLLDTSCLKESHSSGMVAGQWPVQRHFGKSCQMLYHGGWWSINLTNWHSSITSNQNFLLWYKKVPSLRMVAIFSYFSFFSLGITKNLKKIPQYLRLICFPYLHFLNDYKKMNLFNKICFHYSQIHQFVKLDSSYKQSFIPPSYMIFIKIFLVLLTDSPHISVVCSFPGRENYLFFWFSVGCSPVSLFKTAPKFDALFHIMQSFINLFSHYPNLFLKSFENFLYFSAVGFG